MVPVLLFWALRNSTVYSLKSNVVKYLDNTFRVNTAGAIVVFASYMAIVPVYAPARLRHDLVRLIILDDSIRHE